MKLIKKLVAWFEYLLWKSVMEDMLENPEHMEEYNVWRNKDGDTK